MNPTLTAHAQWRMAQRNIRADDLEYVLNHGRRIRTHTGSLHVFLGHRDAPEEDRAGRGWQLVGTTVVIDRNEVVTVYRNRRAMTKLKKRGRWRGNGFRG